MVGKRVVVTGGIGSLGSYVVAELDAHVEVTVVDVKVGPRNAELGPVDIRDTERLTKIFRGADAVLHLGALDAVVEAPTCDFFDVNVHGTYCVLEAAAASRVQRFVYCSSESVYGLAHDEPRVPLRYLPIDEDHPTLPTSAYGTSKLLGESLVRVFAGRYGFSACSVRLAGVVVPEMYKLIKTIVREDEETWYVPVRPISQYRPVMVSPITSKHLNYIDPRDAATFFRAALQTKHEGYRIYNAAAEDTLLPYPTIDYCRIIEGRDIKVRDATLYDSFQRASPLSSKLAEAELNWKPKYSWSAVDQRLAVRS